MISNGFIRVEDGEWFSMQGLDRVVVLRMEALYPGDTASYWEIEGIWIDKDIGEINITIAKDFQSPDDAQWHLDFIMRGGK